MTEQNQPNSFNFITPELTHRVELILHLLEYSNHLVIVKGEHESGKSTLCEELFRQEETNLIIRKLTTDTHTTLNDIFRVIIDGDKKDELQESDYSQAALNQWLERSQNKQQIPVLLIDNVDLFNDDLINSLFEILINSNSVAVLHFCLFCDSSFLDRLEEPGISHDDARSLHIIEMPSLSEKQTEQYIHSKYPEGNAEKLNLFDEKTIKQIHRISHGMPGRINALCEQYLDDPAKKSEPIEAKPLHNIKTLLLKNKLILIIVVSLLFLSVGMTTLLHHTPDEQVETQTIKLNLPDKDKDKDKDKVEVEQTEIVSLKTPPAAEPILQTEPVTIEDLSPSVIPELVNDLKNKSEVTVYNAEGQVVAKESDLQLASVIDKNEEVTLNVDTTIPPEKITEIVVEPQPKPKPKPTKAEKPSAPFVKDINWLIKQDSKKYVLQLIGAYEKETIDIYLKSFKNGDNKIIAFIASNKGKEWHVLVYGLFNNRDDAVAAIEKLPTKAKLMAPWPRTVESIKELLK
jgi:DamX protein